MSDLGSNRKPGSTPESELFAVLRRDAKISVLVNGEGKRMAVASESGKRVLTPEERECILRELGHILSHSSFRNSDRSIKLLRYLVESAVDGHAQSIKERTIGHDVFGRDAGYETSTDPIVRNSASEVRKRLAQYYLAPDCLARVRIELVPGTYFPEFHFPEARPSLAPVPVGPGEPAPGELVPGLAPNPRGWNEAILTTAAIVALCAAALGIGWLVSSYWVRHREAAAVDRFWGPVFASKREPIVSVGLRASNVASAQTPNSLPTLAVADASSYAAIEGLLDTHDRKFRMLTADQTKYSDLRDRPVVLIGGFNNPWMLQVNSKLRYRIVRDTSEFKDEGKWKPCVEDAQNPRMRWKSSNQENPDEALVEYAIAGRVADTAIAVPTYFIAGAGSHAAEAAAAFITQQKYLEKLPTTISDPDVNVEVVLKINLVGGVVGAPEVVALASW